MTLFIFASHFWWLYEEISMGLDNLIQENHPDRTHDAYTYNSLNLPLTQYAWESAAWYWTKSDKQINNMISDRLIDSPQSIYSNISYSLTYDERMFYIVSSLIYGSTFSPRGRLRIVRGEGFISGKDYYIPANGNLPAGSSYIPSNWNKRLGYYQDAIVKFLNRTYN